MSVKKKKHSAIVSANNARHVDLEMLGEQLLAKQSLPDVVLDIAQDAHNLRLALAVFLTGRDQTGQARTSPFFLSEMRTKETVSCDGLLANKNVCTPNTTDEEKQHTGRSTAHSYAAQLRTHFLLAFSRVRSWCSPGSAGTARSLRTRSKTPKGSPAFEWGVMQNTCQRLQSACIRMGTPG